MKIPGPTEISAVRAGVAQEPESDSRTRALAILSGALDEQHTAAARSCAHCGARMSPRWPRTRVGNELWCPSCAQNAPRQYSPYPKNGAAVSERYAVRSGIGTLPLDASPQQGLAFFLAVDKPHIVRLAHDSGSTEIIYHCPFCGSGQVIARSDGTVECEFCQAAFTVQVQPEFSAFPQTIDGQPVDLPGMGGTSDNPDVAPDEDNGEAAAGPTDIPGGNETQPPEEGEDDDSEDEPVDSGGNPLFNKKSYRTASGGAVDRDAYIRHLALGVTDNRDRLLARMRGEKSR